MMQLALFAPFMEADLLAERILAAAPRQKLQINECNLQDDVLLSDHLGTADLIVSAAVRHIVPPFCPKILVNPPRIPSVFWPN